MNNRFLVKGVAMENNNNINPDQQGIQYQPQAQPLYQPVQGDSIYQQPYQPDAQYQPPQYQQAYQSDAQYQPQPAQYQQQYPQYAQYPVQPYMAAGQNDYAVPSVDEEAAKIRKKGNLLCFISLALYIVPYVLSSFLSGVTNSISNLASDNHGMAEMLTYVLTGATGGTYIASWVLVIIARIKYKCTFSKVLLWIYIGMLIATIVMLIVAIAACALLAKSCSGIPG